MAKRRLKIPDPVPKKYIRIAYDCGNHEGQPWHLWSSEIPEEWLTDVIECKDCGHEIPSGNRCTECRNKPQNKPRKSGTPGIMERR